MNRRTAARDAAGITAAGSRERSLVLAGTLVYCALAANLPFFVPAESPVDDGLFVRLGRELAEGRWLGTYDMTTLAKGPGYPFLLAVFAWLGLPVSIGHALLHCGAAVAAGALVGRMARSRRLGTALALGLIFLPSGLSPGQRRIFREAVYPDQTLLLLVLAGATLLLASSRRARWAGGVVTGSCLGWVWLTREEGVWLLPALAVIAVAATAGVEGSRRRESVLAILAIATSFLAIQGGYRLGNLLRYERWTGVEIHDRAFRRVMAALRSVEAGEAVPFVPVHRGARAAAYAASPSFAALRPVIDPPGGLAWQHGCQALPVTCGDIAGGQFLWALRTALQRVSDPRSAAEAAAHWNRIAQELEAACASGALRCARARHAFVPRLSVAQLATVPARIAASLRLVSVSQSRQVEFARSTGPRGDFEQMLDFVHHPSHRPLASDARRVWLEGWFQGAGNRWFRAWLESPGGARTPLALERRASPEIARTLENPLANRQRFVAAGECEPGCVLIVRPSGGAPSRLALSEIRNPRKSFAVDGGTLHFDGATLDVDGHATRPAGAALTAFAAVWAVYRGLLSPLLAAGIVAWTFAIASRPKSDGRSPLMVLASAAWVGVATRVALIVAIDASAFSAVNFQYLVPASPLALLAAVSSIAVALERFRRRDSGVAPDAVPA